jgi:WD40 repeat protein
MSPNTVFMKSQARRRFAFGAVLGLLLSAVLSCSHRSAAPPSTAPPITPIPPHASVLSKPAVAPPKHLPLIALPDLETDSVTFSPDGRRLAFGYGADSAITVLDLTTGRLAWQRHIDSADSGPILFTRNGRRMIVSCYDPDVAEPLWICTAGGRLVRKLPGEASGDNLWLVRGERFLVTSGLPVWEWSETNKDQQPWLSVWDTRTWHRTAHFHRQPKDVLSLTVSGHIVRRSAHSEFASLRPPDGPPDEAGWKRTPQLPYDAWATKAATAGG